VRLGVAVSCVFYRSAAEVARMAADVDRMSGGRLVLGLGIGIEDVEFGTLGMTMPPVQHRFEALEDTVVTVRRLWSGPMQFPPIQSPRVPILIAGGGEKRTLRQVAQFADVAMLAPTASMGPMNALTVDDVRRKLSVLEQHCREIDRPVASVLVTHGTQVVIAESRERVIDKLNAIPEGARERFRNMSIIGTPEEVTQQYQALVDAGLTYFAAGVRGNDLETLELLGTRVTPNVSLRGEAERAVIA
jgi:alkanesulfonate monooxygenase SsuD/methylene tetrahydromethanopterin reductase-like flavin-dependent oxidoreductase (luciferase family)